MPQRRPQREFFDDDCSRPLDNRTNALL